MGPASRIAELPHEEQREILRGASPKVIRELAREGREKVRAERRENDLYRSAAGHLRPLLPLLSDCASVIECCVGAGDLAVPLRKASHHVTTCDIDPKHKATIHGDATKAETWERIDPADWVISNLPFNAAIDILPHALAKARIGVAVILRLTFLEPTTTGGKNGGPRAEWLSRHPPTKMIVLPRYSYTGDGHTDSVTCAWVIWQRGEPPAIFIPMPDADGMPGEIESTGRLATG